MSPILVRTYAGRPVPNPGLYVIDSAHTSVEFIARNLMITKVRGRFSDVTGSIVIDELPERSHVDARIGVASLYTGNSQRDAHLLSADFFDVERFPTCYFSSTHVEADTAGQWSVHGDLTLHGVTHPIRLQTGFEGAGSVGVGDDRIGFSARASIDRDDWGISWNAPLETGGVLVGKQIHLELEVQAVAQARHRGEFMA